MHDEDVTDETRYVVPLTTNGCINYCPSVKPKEEDHHQELMLNSKSVVVEMDDNIDEEMIAVLLEPSYVENFALCNTEVCIDRFIRRL